MSSEDTDIIEVALETLIALEKLRVVLDSREQSLLLWSARMEWEETRRSICKDYVSLMRDISALVTSSARWTSAAYTGSGAVEVGGIAASSSSQSIPDNNSEGSRVERERTHAVSDLARQQCFATISEQRTALHTRANTLIRNQIPRSSEALDAIIEQRQAPDTFLDEQDDLEMLASSLDTTTHFMQELVAQWKTADELFVRTRLLHQAAKDLIADLAKAKMMPDSTNGIDHENATQGMIVSLRDLCGKEQADKFLASAHKPSTHLRFSSRHFLPLPRHDHWPDQSEHDGIAISTLHRELAAAAKRVKQAVDLRRLFAEAQMASHEASCLLDKLTTLSDDQRGIASRIYERFSSLAKAREPSSWQEIIESAFRNGAHHGVEIPAEVANLNDEHRVAEGHHGESDRILSELFSKLKVCQSSGLEVSSLQDKAQIGRTQWSQSNDELATTLESARQLVQTWQLMQDLYQLCRQSEEMIQHSAELQCRQVTELSFTVSKIDDSFERESHVVDQKEAKARLDAIEASLVTLSSNALASWAGEIIEDLKSRYKSCAVTLRDLGLLSRWAENLRRQRQSISGAYETFNTLKYQAMLLQQEVSRSGSENLSDVDFDLLDSKLTKIRVAVETFKQSQTTSLVFIGEPPSLERDDFVELKCPDQEMEQLSHTWCLWLDNIIPTLQDRLKDIAAQLQEVPSREATEDDGPASANSADETDGAGHADSQGAGNVERGGAGSIQSDGSGESREEATEARTPQVDLFDAPPSLPTPHFEQQEISNAKLEEQDAVSECVEPLHFREDPADTFDMEHSHFIKAVAACDNELRRRERGFTRTLQSTNSRRLPLRAFLTELDNRRREAEDELTRRTDAVAASLARLVEVQAHFASDEKLDNLVSEANAERTRLDVEVARLLASFQASIEQEGVGKDVDLSPLGTPARDRSWDPQRLLSSVSPKIRDLGLPLTPRSLSASNTLPPDIINEVERLNNTLTTSAVEKQTALDGVVQAAEYLDLPTRSEADHILAATVASREQSAALCARYPYDPRVSKLHITYGQHLARVERLNQLAAFAEQAIQIEESLALFLTLIDSVSAPEGSSLELSPETPSASQEDPFSIDDGNQDLSRIDSQKKGIGEDHSPDLSKKDEIAQRLAKLEQKLELITCLAAPVTQDLRIRRRVEQVQRSFVDMAEMARDVLDPAWIRSASALSYATTEATLSVPSTPLPDDASIEDPDELPIATSAFAMPSTPSRIPRRRASVAPSDPLTEHSRVRTISLTTPSRETSAMMTPSRIPMAAALTATPTARLRKSSSNSNQATPKPLPPSRIRPRLPSIAQLPAATPPRFAQATAASNARKHRSEVDITSVMPLRRASLTPSMLPIKASPVPLTQTKSSMNSSRPNRYRANPRSKLDVAVGKVINRLPMQVSIVHASKAPQSKGRDEWKDDSGRYWVGHPDPKLCFCRILRSRTIMVRVGGGWQELTRYLLAHYRDSLALSTSSSVFNAVDGEAASKTKSTMSSPILHIKAPPATGPLSPAAQTSNDSAGSTQMSWITPVMARGQLRMASSSSTASATMARMARSPSQAPSIAGDISSPIFLNSDGSPQQVRLISPHHSTPTSARKASARMRAISLQSTDGRSPSGKFKQHRSPVPPLPSSIPSPDASNWPARLSQIDDNVFSAKISASKSPSDTPDDPKKRAQVVQTSRELFN